MEIIEELPDSTEQEELNQRERFWISALNCLVPNGYNLTTGGDGRYFLSDETKTKIAESQKKAWETREVDVEHFREMATGNTNRLGVVLSEETRQKISDAQTGRVLSEETKQKMSESALAYHADHPERTEAQQEATRKAQEALKGRPAWNRGQTSSEETRQKLSEAHKGQIAWNKGVCKFTPEEQVEKRRQRNKEYAAKRRAERGAQPRPPKSTAEERTERKRLENKAYKEKKKAEKLAQTS
jgi:hypothetical protein